MKKLLLLLIVLITFVGVTVCFANDATSNQNVIQCKSVEEVTTKLTAAKPGDIIELKNGNYALGTLNITCNGTADKPITFRAQTVGGVIFNDAAKLMINGKYVIIDGFTLNGDGGYIEFQKDSSYSSLFNTTMDKCGNDTWVAIWGTHIRVAYCAFKNKTGSKAKNKEMFRLRVGVEHYAQVDHNYFYNYQFLKEHPYDPILNGTECIQVGMYLEKRPNGDIPWKNVPSHSVIEYNYFNKWYGETEFVSVKASDTIIRYNTIEDCYGTVTLRQADDCQVNGNFFLQQGNPLAGGVRVYGARHKIYNNYFAIAGESSIRTGVSIQNGKSDPGLDPQPARDTLVAFNTFVDCKNQSITFGGSGHPVSPAGCIIANNIFKSNNGVVIRNDRSTPSNTKYEGNILFGAELGIPNPGGFKTVDPKLVLSNELYRIPKKSPARHGAVGSYDFINVDISGLPRVGRKKDVGAEQFMTKKVLKPLTANDVGPRAR